MFSVMRIEPYKRKWVVVKGYWFWKRVLSVHPTKQMAERWVRLAEEVTDPS